MDADAMRTEVGQLPTVESGLIVLLTRIRHEIEAHGADAVAMADLARRIDQNSTEWADAIIAGTPAEEPTQARARAVQGE